jgi:uncharacterized membrane protein YccC
MFKRTYVAQSVRILAACAIAYGASQWIGLKESYWALITAVVVTQPALSDTLPAGKDRVIGTLIGAIAGLGVIGAAYLGYSSSILFWIALIPLAILTAMRANLRLSCVTLAVVVLVPSTGAPFVRPLDRVFAILLGTLASVVVSAAIRGEQKLEAHSNDAPEAPKASRENASSES